MKNTHTIQTLQYPISFKVNSGVALDAFLENKSYSKLFVLMDENTYTHCYPILMQDSVNLAEAELLVIDAGEENKSIEIGRE